MPLKIFLSYATPNRVIAEPVWLRLRASGHEVYYAEKTLPLGAKIPPELELRIKQCDVFIVLWSAAAKASDWVSQEIGIAQGSGRVILPVILEAGLRPPGGFIQNRRYLPAYEEFEKALAFLDQHLRDFAQAKQQREAAALLKAKQEKEKALVILGLATLVLLAIGSAGE